mmetsp:Transcript_2381/g.9129  ORF Transcript_2381/g.9129 Transcript_2381/m.9129 type:complete len:204 (+) Transcript_2381:129-740(+)
MEHAGVGRPLARHRSAPRRKKKHHGGVTVASVSAGRHDESRTTLQEEGVRRAPGPLEPPPPSHPNHDASSGNCAQAPRDRHRTRRTPHAQREERATHLTDAGLLVREGLPRRRRLLEPDGLLERRRECRVDTPSNRERQGQAPGRELGEPEAQPLHLQHVGLDLRDLEHAAQQPTHGTEATEQTATSTTTGRTTTTVTGARRG